MIYEKEQILSGYNFARISDLVFAENLISSDNKPVPTIFDLSILDVEPKNIIFCKTDYILQLFEKIKILPEWYELKIITHESDYEINQKLFQLKPKCVYKWFAINITYFDQNLIPVPLGIGNDHSHTTLKLENLNNKDVCEKEALLYINHRVETNYKERAWIYEYFKDKKWCTLKEPNLSLADFKKDLNKHHFMLCPKGNGIDTHRLWECLYSGIIPIVEKHITYKNLQDLPILFVDSFKDLTEELLLSNIDLLKNKSLDRLNICYWKELIKRT